MLLFIFGTRPEVIKLVPIILELKNKNIPLYVCNTEQQKDLTEQTLSFFRIKPNVCLNIMIENQNLNNLTANLMVKITEIIKEIKPTKIIVQGDTTSAFVGALSGFYEKIPVYHVEAGLRTGNIYSPCPEEMNRLMISKLTTLHFVPTEYNKNNLLKEGIEEEVIKIVGNTVIDCLFLTLDKVNQNISHYDNKFKFLDKNKKLILLTCHRRENFGEPLNNILEAILEISKNHKDIEFIFPVHPNPNIKKIVYDKLSSNKNIHLIEPVDYPDLIYIMQRSYFIMTDSGGIQEEAPSLRKLLLILRNDTERQEIVDIGIGKLVGTEKDNIVFVVNNLLNNIDNGMKMGRIQVFSNPYGNGDSAKRIAEYLV